MYHDIATAISAYAPSGHSLDRPTILGVWQRHNGAIVLTEFLQHTRRLHNRITADTFDPWVQALPFLGAAWGPDFKPELAKKLELLGVALLARPQQTPNITHAWVACAAGVGLHAAYGPGETTTVLTPDNTDRLHHPAINELESLRADIIGTKPVQIRWAHDCWPWQTCTGCRKRNANCECASPAHSRHT